MSRFELAFVGAGNMAEAIARGLIRAGLYAPDRLLGVDPVEARRSLFADQLSIHSTADVGDAKQARIIMLSVKPQMMAGVLEALVGLNDSTLVISIAAGISISTIESGLGPGNHRVIRTMPNTPMLYGAGMVAMARGSHATDDDLSVARRIFESSAKVIELDEDKIDAVTAVSGSGPAYFFWLVEQMVAAGISCGLSETEATTLARETAYGAGVMLRESSDTATELRRKVTSPGGTTQAAIESLGANAAEKIVQDAVRAAHTRGRELAG